MSQHWTIAELKRVSNLRFAKCCVLDTHYTNPWAPKKRKMDEAVDFLDKMEELERAFSYMILPIKEVPLHINDPGQTPLERRILKWRLAERT